MLIKMRLMVDQGLLQKLIIKMNKEQANLQSGGAKPGINPLLLGLSAALAKKVETQKKENEFIKIKMEEIASLSYP